METILCIPCCSATSHANYPTMNAHDKGTTPSRLVHFMKTTISRPKTWISLSFRLCEPPVRRQQATAIFRRQQRLSWMRSLAKRLEMSLGLSPRWGRNLFSHFMRFENFLFFLFFPFFRLAKEESHRNHIKDIDKFDEATLLRWRDQSILLLWGRSNCSVKLLH